MKKRLITPNYILILAIFFTIADLMAAIAYAILGMMYWPFYISIAGSIIIVAMLWRAYVALKKENSKNAITAMTITASLTTALFIYDWVVSYIALGETVVTMQIILSTIFTDVLIAGLFWLIVILLKKENK